MARLFSSLDPWIEDTFVQACEFDLDTPLDPDNDQHDNDDVQSRDDHDESQDTFQESQESQSTCYDDTQNTVPSDLRSQPTDFYVDGRPTGTLPSRQAQLVQVIHRGGSGWIVNGSNERSMNAEDLDSQCPPYLIIHDGQYSAIAFLSPETMMGLGSHNEDYSVKDSSGKNPIESSGVGASAITRSGGRLELPVPRSLIYVSNFTVATARRCLLPGTSSDHIKDLSKKQQDDVSRQLRHFLPEINKNGNTYQSTNSNQLLCLYIMGKVVKEGAENQGFIGNSDDIHNSVRLRRALIDHERWIEEKYSATYALNSVCKDEMEEISHTALLAKMERCHRYYQLSLVKSAKSLSRRIAPDWPWKSVLDENGLRVQHAVGNVAAFLGKNGRSGDVLDIIGEDNNTNGRDAGGERIATNAECRSRVSSSMPMQHGDVTQLFQNGDDFEEILGLSSESEAFVTPNESFTDEGGTLPHAEDRANRDTASTQNRPQNYSAECFETSNESILDEGDTIGKETSLQINSKTLTTNTAATESKTPVCKNGGGSSTLEEDVDLDDSSGTVDLDENHGRSTPHKNNEGSDDLPSFVGINDMLVDEDEESAEKPRAEQEDICDDIVSKEVVRVHSDATKHPMPVKMQEVDFNTSPLARSNSVDVEDDTPHRPVTIEESKVFPQINQRRSSSGKKCKEDTDPDEAICSLSQIPIATKRPCIQPRSQHDFCGSNFNEEIHSRNFHSQQPLPVEKDQGIIDDSKDVSIQIRSPHRSEGETIPVSEDFVSTDEQTLVCDKKRENVNDADENEVVGLSQIPIKYRRPSKQIQSQFVDCNTNFEQEIVDPIVLPVSLRKDQETGGVSERTEGHSYICSQVPIKIRPPNVSDPFEPSITNSPESTTDVTKKTLETNKPCHSTSHGLDPKFIKSAKGDFYEDDESCSQSSTTHGRDPKGSKSAKRGFDEDDMSCSQSISDQLFTQDDSTRALILKHPIGFYHVDLSHDLDADQPAAEAASSRYDANNTDKPERRLPKVHDPERGENDLGKCTVGLDYGLVGTNDKSRTHKRRSNEKFNLGSFFKKAKRLCGL